MSTKTADAAHWTDRAPSRKDKRAVTFYLDQGVFEELKMRAARDGFRPIQGIMEELVIDYLGHGAAPVDGQGGAGKAEGKIDMPAGAGKSRSRATKGGA